MSYDVSFNIPTGAVKVATIADFNHTYNCAKMFKVALGGLSITDLDGMSSHAITPKLREAVETMKNPDLRGIFESMNPKNGWGSYETALSFLEKLYETAKDHPMTFIQVS